MKATLPMPKTARPQSKHHFTVRGVLVILIFIVAFAGILVLFVPSLLLRALNFVPRGNVQTFWAEVTPEATAEIGGLPPILTTRLPPRVIIVATNTQTDPPTPSPQPMQQITPTRPIQTLAETESAVPPTPVESIESTATPSEVEPTATMTVSPTPTNPFADWFSVASQPNSVRIQSRGYLNLTLKGDKTFADALWIGEDADHQPLGIAEFDESSIPQLCAVYLLNCRDPRFRIDRVDFHPGGMMVYGSINVMNAFWQPVGVVLLLDDNGINLNVAGMIWNDEVYEPPKTGPIATTLSDLMSRGNTALNRLNIYAANYDLTISELYFDDSRFIAVLRSASAQ